MGGNGDPIPLVNDPNTQLSPVPLPFSRSAVKALRSMERKPFPLENDGMLLSNRGTESILDRRFQGGFLEAITSRCSASLT